MNDAASITTRTALVEFTPSSGYFASTDSGPEVR
jgi:hypothetical protein